MNLFLLLIQLAAADAICNDGTYSYSWGSGTCSWHGGVNHWVTPKSTEEIRLEKFLEITQNDREKLILYTPSCDDLFDLHNEWEKCISEITPQINQLNKYICNTSQSYLEWPSNYTLPEIRKKLSEATREDRVLARSKRFPHYSFDSEEDGLFPNWEGFYAGDGYFIIVDKEGMIQVVVADSIYSNETLEKGTKVMLYSSFDDDKIIFTHYGTSIIQIQSMRGMDMTVVQSYHSHICHQL